MGVNHNLNCKLPKKFTINNDGKFDNEVDACCDSVRKASYIYQAILHYPVVYSLNLIEEYNSLHNAEFSKDLLQDLMDKFIKNLETYDIEVECPYRFATIYNYESVYSIEFVDKDGCKPDKHGYLIDNGKIKEFVDYVLSSSENTVKFIFDNRYIKFKTC